MEDERVESPFRTRESLGVVLGAIVLLLTSYGQAATTSETQEVVSRDHEFAAVETLVLKQLKSRLAIDVQEVDRVGLRIEGPTALVDAVSVALAEGVLTLEMPESSGPSGFQGTASSLTIVNDTVIVTTTSGGSLTRWDKLSLDLVVPEGLPTQIHGFAGTGEIGDTQGQIEVDLASGTLVLGRVASASLAISGSGSIRVSRVNGDLSVRVGGSGSVHVDGGQTAELSVTVSGAGDVRIGAPADRATLQVSGAGQIHVVHVREEPRITASGAGLIRVENW